MKEMPRQKVSLLVLKATNIEHLQKLANLDAVCEEKGWTLGKFRSELTHPKTIGVGVFDEHMNLWGYVIFDYRDSQIVVIALRVDPYKRRSGVGTKLMEYLLKVIRPLEGKGSIVVEVCELNEIAWSFLRSFSRSNGADTKVRVIKDKPYDRYRFTFKETEKEEACAVSST